MTQPWTGDFDGIVARRRLRILTPYSQTYYSVDRGVQRGLVYDAGLRLEEALNARLRTSASTRVHVVFVPTPRDRLFQALIDGQGDLIAANLGVTGGGTAPVDFTTPVRRAADEIIVGAPGLDPIGSVDALAGRVVHVRHRSAHVESLRALSAALVTRGLPPIAIEMLPASLEDEDVLQIVSAGLLQITVVHDFIAALWRRVLPALVLHPHLVVRSAGPIAWAVRKDSPKLLAALNPIIEAHRFGTLFGNLTFRKYLRAGAFVTTATGSVEQQRFVGLVDVFRTYAARYQLDPLLLMAQAYQESRLDQRARSRAGAVGLMQILPATARDLGIDGIHRVDANVHAGAKYIRRLIDEHFGGARVDALNRMLFAFAAYNAGPARIRQLRRASAARGLDPNIWFDNVERLAGERIGREPVQYVSNIFKYFVAYSLAERR